MNFYTKENFFLQTKTQVLFSLNNVHRTILKSAVYLDHTNPHISLLINSTISDASKI